MVDWLGGAVGAFVGAVNPVAAHEAATFSSGATALGIAGAANLLSQYVGGLAGRAATNLENGHPIIQGQDFPNSAQFDLASIGGALIGVPVASGLAAATTGLIARNGSPILWDQFLECCWWERCR